MSLACLVCHSVESPSHSFRSYSVSSSDNEGRCSAVANCLARKTSLPSARPAITTTSKVAPQPNFQNSVGMAGPPRLVRSRAVRRDLVRDWNFEEVFWYSMGMADNLYSFLNPLQIWVRQVEASKIASAQPSLDSIRS
ncbi:hypothetical protein Golob_015236 [Gossypium lobatum]|uniref:Uncharacterized protein n=1 Tax=Gossypium lobatum TaxID=34289 RepID=A0A7J8M0G4_9ROSI|nr:hypothetical protein [Gossypium lobatum]